MRVTASIVPVVALMAAGFQATGVQESDPDGRPPMAANASLTAGNGDTGKLAAYFSAGLGFSSEGCSFSTRSAWPHSTKKKSGTDRTFALAGDCSDAGPRQGVTPSGKTAAEYVVRVVLEPKGHKAWATQVRLADGETADVVDTKRFSREVGEKVDDGRTTPIVSFATSGKTVAVTIVGADEDTVIADITAELTTFEKTPAGKPNPPLSANTVKRRVVERLRLAESLAFPVSDALSVTVTVHPAPAE
ncbi:MAG: hypothetical protein HYX69_05170 [Planctomycetia bacterium]|nr:hypothetical protein [Planctomycetia bacterium]